MGNKIQIFGMEWNNTYLKNMNEIKERENIEKQQIVFFAKIHKIKILYWLRWLTLITEKKLGCCSTWTERIIWIPEFLYAPPKQVHWRFWPFRNEGLEHPTRRETVTFWSYGWEARKHEMGMEEGSYILWLAAETVSKMALRYFLFASSMSGCMSVYL